MDWYEHTRGASSLEELAATTLPQPKAPLRAEAALFVVGSAGAPTTVWATSSTSRPTFTSPRSCTPIRCSASVAR